MTPKKTDGEPVGVAERPHTKFRRDAMLLAMEMDGADFAGCLDDITDDTVEALARTLAIVAAGYDWTVDTKTGNIVGCVAGDMGYASTNLKVDDATLKLLAASPAEPIMGETMPLHFVFTDFPGPGDECVFVEVETPDRRSVNAGEWRKRDDGLVELVVPGLIVSPALLRSQAAQIAALSEANAALEVERRCVRAILAGKDIVSLPNDYPTVRMAEGQMKERSKFMWQVRDTCTRAERAEAALSAATAEIERLKGPRRIAPSEAVHVEGCDHPRSPIWLCDCPRVYDTLQAEAAEQLSHDLEGGK